MKLPWVSRERYEERVAEIKELKDEIRRLRGEVPQGLSLVTPSAPEAAVPTTPPAVMRASRIRGSAVVQMGNEAAAARFRVQSKTGEALTSVTAELAAARSAGVKKASVGGMSNGQ